MLHYFRCRNCLSISTATDLPRNAVTCGACSGTVEHLGRVHEDQKRLVNDHQVPACDGRCTNATGPNCFCRCGCVNHGTGRLVTITTDAGGIPTITPLDLDEARARAAEYLKWKNALVRAFDMKFPGIREVMGKGIRIDRVKWNAWREAKDIRERAAASTNHNNRIKLLRKHVEKLLGRTLEEVS